MTDEIGQIEDPFKFVIGGFDHGASMALKCGCEYPT